MMIFRSILLVCFMLRISSSAFAQSPASPVREKVHLHFDKPVYAAGDTIWFKAYVVNAGSTELSSTSGVLHVDLVNRQDRLSYSLLLPLSMGLGRGDILLPDTLEEGSYRIRAYTTWMRNFGQESFFEKTIPVVNAFKPVKATGTAKRVAPGDTIKRLANAPEIRFFPESGELVNGLRSKVGIKVTGIDGLGQSASGEVVDQDGKTVALYTTAHAGIGIFPLTPEEGRIYTAITRIAGMAEQRTALPAVSAAGYVLSIDNRDRDTLLVNVVPDRKTSAQAVVVKVQGDCETYFSLPIAATPKRSVVKIPRADLPHGVTRITLFSASEEPLAERLVFNDLNNNVLLNIKADKDGYRAGDKIALELGALGTDSIPVSGSFSMAVTNLEKVPYDEDSELSIRASLLLAADLKGSIERPNYYFTGTTAADSLLRAGQLDNLLLTQGWRTFTWQTGDSTAYQPEQGLEISGRLTNPSNKPIANSLVSLFANIDGAPFLRDTTTSADGRFRFNALDFDDNTPFSIQTKDVKNRYNTRVTIDKIPAPEIRRTAATQGIDTLQQPATFLEAGKRRFKELDDNNFVKRGIRLNEVKLLGEKKVYSSSPYERNFSDHILDTNRLKGHHTIQSAIYQANPFIIMEGNLFMNLQGSTEKAPRIQPRFFQVMVDGQKVPNDYVNMIRPEDVESVEVIKKKLAEFNFAGLIVINTKRKDPNHDWSKEVVAGIRAIRPPGYAKVREFYVPKYQATRAIPDLRDVVYWNPNLVTDENGKTAVNFVNADTKGSYLVVVEGLSADGRLGRSTYRYEVN